MKQVVLIIAASCIISLAYGQSGAFSYGYVSHTQQLTSVDKELLHIQDMSIKPEDFNNVYKSINGEAFFSKDWILANAVTKQSIKYTNLKVKFDLYKNCFYIDFNDTIYNSSPDILRYDLFPDAPDTNHVIMFVKGIVLPAPATDKYVQLLTPGKLTFVKYHMKDVQEVYENSFLEKEKKFVDKIYYYVISENGQPLEVTLNKKNLQKALADKWEEVTKYIKSNNNISYSGEENWVSIINYYNTL